MSDDNSTNNVSDPAVHLGGTNKPRPKPKKKKKPSSTTGLIYKYNEPTREQMTDMAAPSVALVLEQRGAIYGPFIENARVAQEIKNALRRDTNWFVMPLDEREALDVMASKMARAVTGKDHLDNWIDICGYGQLVINRRNELETNEEKNNAAAVRKLSGKG